MVAINSRTSTLRWGRPPRARDFQRQKRRQPCRCQRTTVSGVTKTRCSRQRTQNRRPSTHSSLSQVRSRACDRVRVGRVSTASWWRSSRFSRTRSRRARATARSVVSKSQRSSITHSALPIYGRATFCRPTARTGSSVGRAGTSSGRPALGVPRPKPAPPSSSSRGGFKYRVAFVAVQVVTVVDMRDAIRQAEAMGATKITEIARAE